MSLLETLTTQPNFPSEDLAEKNIPHVEFYLQHERSNEALREHFRGSLRMVHQLGHNALLVHGANVDYSEREYNAFCDGFAALEFTSTLVRKRQLDTAMMVANTRTTLIEGGDIAELLIAEEYPTWLENHPNTMEVITDAGVNSGETMKQLHARSMGAFVAGRLWWEA